MNKTAIEKFLHAQAKAWNDGDKSGFFGAYSAAAPSGIEIEYVGQPAGDGGTILEAMWAQQNAKIQIEELIAIVNGNEAACHNRNWVRGTGTWIETIELYRFGVLGPAAGALLHQKLGYVSSAMRTHRGTWPSVSNSPGPTIKQPTATLSMVS